MPMPPTVDDDSFAVMYRTSPTLTDLAQQLGLAKSTVSTRAARLRARGVDLPLFPVGRAPTLPSVLQVRRWEWIGCRSLRRVHRRVPGEPVTLCGSEILQPFEVSEAHPGERCPQCWPVEDYPPRKGSLPAPAPGAPPEVVVEVAYGRVVMLRLDPTWKRWVDIETSEAHEGAVRAVRWWRVRPRRGN